MADDHPRNPASSDRDADLRTDPLLTRIPEVEGQKVLEPCVLYAKVGEGGMGAVYRGRHLNLEVDVAIKCLKAGLAEQSPDFITRFQREAKIAASVHHQNLVQVYDISEKNGVHYLVMEYVRGETSRERVSRKGPLSEREAARILLGAASGLAEAHDQKIVHRDIKPDNILISHDGRVKVSDLGLAKALEVDAGPSLTIGVMGTPQYMSPEQWDESNDMGPETDVWAMGATLYFLLTGDHAIPAGTMQQVYRRVCVDEFPDIAEKLPQISPQLRDILMRCVSRDRAERFPNCSELAVALSRVASSTVLDPEDAGATVGAIRLPPLLSPPPAEKLGRIKVQMHDGESSVVDLARRGILSKPGLVATGAIGVLALLLVGRVLFGGGAAHAEADEDVAAVTDSTSDVADGDDAEEETATTDTESLNAGPGDEPAPDEAPVASASDTPQLDPFPDDRPTAPASIVPAPTGTNLGDTGPVGASPAGASSLGGPASGATKVPAEQRFELDLDATDDAQVEGVQDTFPDAGGGGDVPDDSTFETSGLGEAETTSDLEDDEPLETDEPEVVEPPQPPPPPIPALDGVSGAFWSGDASLGLDGHLEPAEIGLELPESIALVVEWTRAGETVPHEVTVEPNADGAFHVDLAPDQRPDDGRWMVSLRLDDVSSAFEEVVVDTQEPEIVIEGDSVLVSPTEAWSVAFRVNDETAVVVEVVLNGVTEPALESLDADGRFLVERVLPGAENDVVLRATDEAGNVGTLPLTVVVDLDAPRLVDIFPGASARPQAGETYEVRLELDEACTLRFDESVDLVAPYPIDTNRFFSFRVRAAEAGRTSLSFVAVDAAGHETPVLREWDVLTPIALPDGFTAEGEDPDGGFPSVVVDGRTGIRFLRVEASDPSATYLAETECTEAQWLKMLEIAAARPGEPQVVAQLDEYLKRTAAWVTRKGAAPRGLDPETHAQNWIAWRQARDVSEAVGYELPSIELWQEACLRGRPDGAELGCDPAAIEDHAVFRASNPLPVKSKTPNGGGFYDLHGNLWEWCAEPRTQIGGSWASRSVEILGITPPEPRGSETWSDDRAGFRPALTLRRE
ncbi:MAG: bifunctional serine/threonine-protein kinase/formylglycine-generating enzyme family protein [Planctomycetota bacterium]